MAGKYPDSDFSDDEQTPEDIEFSKAADHLRKITSRLNSNQLLKVYALYKQATEGQCTTQKPGWFDARGRSKWEAWVSLGSMSKEEAKKRYIDLVHELDPELEDSSPTQSPKESWAAVSSLAYDPEPELNYQSLTILDAARENLGDVVNKLLTESPALKNVKDDDGLTALHWAADRDATKALTAALEAGFPINAKDNSGLTALHYAASCGHINSTKILVDAGAAMLEDDDGNTPLDLACDADIRKILEGAKN